MRALAGLVMSVALLGFSEPGDDIMRVRLEASAPGKGAEGRTVAVEKAKEDAVLQVVKSVTASDDILKFRPILENASHYIQSCRVLEQKEKDGRTEVKIEAYIADKQLKRDLAALVLPLFPKPPRVVVVVVESGVEGDTANTKAVESTLAEALEQAGLEVVKNADVRARCTGAEAATRIRSEAETAVRFAWENLAEIAVVGELTVGTLPPQNGSNLSAAVAKVVLRIIRGDDARTFDVQTAEALVNSRAPEEGRTMAVADVSDKTKDAVVTSVVLAAAGAKGSPYLLVTIEGLGREAQMDELLERAKTCPGVGEAEMLHFGSDAGRMRIKYNGPVGPLVDLLTEEGYSDFSLIPRQVIDRDMTLAVRK